VVVVVVLDDPSEFEIVEDTGETESTVKVGALTAGVEPLETISFKTLAGLGAGVLVRDFKA
jgi:hypothetical protein